MSRTAALRAQHDRAEHLSKRLQTALAQHRDGEDCTPLARDLAKLVGLLKIHLAQEDRSLYPFMQAHGDSEGARVAQAYQEEMGGLAKAIEAFAARWPGAGAIDRDFAAFRREASDVLLALAQRIERENETLYPLADALAEADFQLAG